MPDRPARHFLRISLTSLALLSLAPGCQTSHSRHIHTLTRTEIFLGLSSPHGQVTEREFQNFLATSVTPRFPAGYTVISIDGYYRYSAPMVSPLPAIPGIDIKLNPASQPATPSTIHEPGRVLLFLHPSSDESDAKIELIRRDYKFRFDQESTLRADSKVQADFE